MTVPFVSLIDNAEPLISMAYRSDQQSTALQTVCLILYVFEHELHPIAELLLITQPNSEILNMNHSGSKV